MDFDINLYEMIDLVHVPEVNREWVAQLKKWGEQGVFSQVNEYELQRQKDFKRLYEVPHLLMENRNRGKHSVQFPFYWFELQQYDLGEWRMVHMEPYEQAYDHQYKILPTDIIREMTEVLVNPKKVIPRKNVRSKLLGKVVDLEFVRYSSTHIYGTVKEHAPDKVRWQGDLETAFQVFYDYRNKYPGLVKHFLEEFLNHFEIELEGEEDAVPLEPEPEPEYIPIPEYPVTYFMKGEDYKDVNLYLLIRLARLDEFSELMMLKLEEFKEWVFKDEIQAYKAKKDHYFKTLFQDHEWSEGKGSNHPQPHWFILTKFKPTDWGTTKIHPWFQPHEPHKEILPEGIFPLLAYTSVDPDRVLSESVALPTSSRKKVDLHWVRYSSNCIMGTVCETLDSWKNVPAERKKTKNDPYNFNPSVLYRTLFRHLESHPDTAKTFIKCFMDFVNSGYKKAFGKKNKKN